MPSAGLPPGAGVCQIDLYTRSPILGRAVIHVLRLSTGRVLILQVGSAIAVLELVTNRIAPQTKKLRANVD